MTTSGADRHLSAAPTAAAEPARVAHGPHAAPAGRGRAVAVLVLGAAIIGFAPILVRLSGAGPAATGFWRLLFALPVLTLLSLRHAHGVAAPSRLSLLAGVAFAFDLGFWHYGIANTSVGKATVLTNLTPVVVTLVAWVVWRQRPTARFALAVALAVGGAAAMTLARGTGPTGPNPALGDALAFATSFWYALYMLAVSAARRHEPTARVMVWSVVTGAPILLAGALLLGESIRPATAAGWAACVGLGLVHAGGQGSIAWALGKLGAATASVTVLVQPVVAATLGWLIFGETLSAGQLAGAAVALSGVVLAQLAPARPAPHRLAER
ncbi:MAG: DMT family transporter [Vicinamibacterales bacterium]